MYKKVLAMVMVVIMLAGIMVMPVSAAVRYNTVNYRDFVTGESVENGTVYLHHNMSNFAGDMRVTPGIRIFDSDDQQLPGGGTNWGNSFTAYANEEYDISFSLFRKGNCLLDISDIPDGSPITISIDWAIYGGGYGTPGLYFLYSYYDAYGAKLEQHRYDVGRDWADQDGGGYIPDFMEHTFTLQKPADAVGMDCFVNLYDFNYVETSTNPDGFATYGVEVVNWGYSVGVPEYKWEKEQEKNEALDSGDENIGEILDVIPDESEGFANALKEFTSAMSYEGTEAVLPIPAVVLPEIKGLIPETVLLESQDFDLGSYIRMMPEWLLLLVQSLLTIALIVYCFKELYDTIAYVMTLRKGA